jgi:hypothetical protein
VIGFFRNVIVGQVQTDCSVSRFNWETSRSLHISIVQVRCSSQIDLIDLPGRLMAESQRKTRDQSSTRYPESSANGNKSVYVFVGTLSGLSGWHVGKFGMVWKSEISLGQSSEIIRIIVFVGC